MLTKFWQLWNLWRNHRSILVNVLSKVVLVSKNIIFNEYFLFWKQRVLFTSKEQQLEQLKQKHILQLNLLGWRIEKIQKITAGSCSSETTNPSSPELAGKTPTKASPIHTDCCLKRSILLEHQIRGIFKRVMIAWSLTMHRAQLKKLKEIMTCTMVIDNQVK